MPPTIRRSTVTARVGGVPIGSGHPIVVQSMTNTDTADVPGTVRQAAALARAGSELVRVTEAAARFPWLSPGEGPLLFQGDGGVTSAERSVQAFLKSAEEHGATLRPDTKVTAISSDGVETERLELGFDMARADTDDGAGRVTRGRAPVEPVDDRLRSERFIRSADARASLRQARPR